MTLAPRMRISPVTMVATWFCWSSAIITSLPIALPGEPIFRSPGGRGLDKICAPVSVSPIVSIIGMPKRVSNFRCVSGGRGADAERAKRSLSVFMSGVTSSFRR